MENQPYNKFYSVGDYLLLELVSGDIFDGEYYKGSEDRIDLINTTEHNNPNKLVGIYSFYRTEIFQIRLIQNTVHLKNLDDKSIKLTLEDFIRLREMSKCYVYLELADDRYYRAVEDLNKHETLGVAAVGLEPRQSASITLLAISTWQNVYIFDMIHLRHGYFYPELKELFESEFVFKVIHNSGCLIEVLSKKYKVFTKNIFDTYFVDLIIQKNGSSCGDADLRGRNISETLVHYLNLPSLLQKSLTITLKKWKERPLHEKQKLFAAQLVTYLIVLKGAMEKILFGKVYDVIENYQEYCSTLSATKLSALSGCKELSDDIDRLIPVFKHCEVKEYCSSSSATQSSGDGDLSDDVDSLITAFKITEPKD